MDIDRTNFPRPELSSLTQDWLINKILDYAYNRAEVEKIKEERKKEELAVTVEGDYPMIRDFPMKWNRILNNPPHVGLFFLAQFGYIPREWFDKYKEEREWAEDILRAGINLWNERNTEQWNPKEIKWEENEKCSVDSS